MLGSTETGRTAVTISMKCTFFYICEWCLIWFFGSWYGLVLVLVASTNSQLCEIIIHLFLWTLPVPIILCHCKRFFDHLYWGQTRGWKELFKYTILIVKQKLQGESWRAIVVGPFCLKHFSFSFVSGKWGVSVPFQLFCLLSCFISFFNKWKVAKLRVYHHLLGCVRSF